MDKANWDDAVRHLERAVAIAPNHIYHRLELAEVYTDLGRYSKARAQLQVIARCPRLTCSMDSTRQTRPPCSPTSKNEKDET